MGIERASFPSVAAARRGRWIDSSASGVSGAGGAVFLLPTAVVFAFAFTVREVDREETAASSAGAAEVITFFSRDDFFGFIMQCLLRKLRAVSSPEDYVWPTRCAMGI